MSAATNRTSWARLLATQALFIASLTAWKFYGIEQAGNLFQFLAWLAAVMSLMIGLFPRLGATKISIRTPMQKAVGEAFAFAMVLALAWFGHFVLATFYFFGIGAVKLHRSRFDADGKPIKKDPA